MRTRSAALLLAAALAAGCATGRAPRPASVPLPEQWDAAEESAPLEVPPLAELFADPHLAGLLAEGLESNRNLEAAAARVERAAAQARIAGADLYPQAALSFDAARRRQNFIGLPIPGAEGQVLSNTSTTFGTSLNVSWEADVWGRLRSARTAARADAESVAADFDFARLSLAGQIAKSWFALLEAREQLELATRTEANRRENAARIRRRYEEGLVPAVELRLAESNAALAASRGVARRRQLDGVTRQLEVLLGRYPSAALEGAELPRTAAAVRPGIPASVLGRRPDLRAAERRAVAASARVAQARASLYPQFRLTGSAGTATDELGRLLDGDYAVWSLLFNVVQPLFQGGRLRAGVDLASAGEREAVAMFANAALLAFAEVESALAAQELLARQESDLAIAAAHAVEAQRSAEQRFAAGLADYLLVLESQRQAFEVESQLLDARRQRLASRVDLYLALGGEDAADAEADVVVTKEVE
jgi:outer membrane protein, multidrug efflux system